MPANFVDGFDARDLTILVERGNSALCAWKSEFDGKDYVHIRILFKKFGKWTPGKGTAVEAGEFPTFLAQLNQWAEKHVT